MVYGSFDGRKVRKAKRKVQAWQAPLIWFGNLFCLTMRVCTPEFWGHSTRDQEIPTHLPYLCCSVCCVCLACLCVSQ
jgi:hypothetical protein